VMGDLPKWKMMVSLWWVTYPDVREKDFRKGSQYLETCPFYFFIFIFIFIKKNSTLLLGNGLKIGWPSYFKNFRKTHVVFFSKKNGLNIGWPACLNFKRNHLTSRKWNSAGSQFIFFSVATLTWDSIS